MFSSSGERLVVALFGAIVICFLAFLFRWQPAPERSVVIGEPDYHEHADIGGRQSLHARGPNRYVPSEDTRAEAVRESGLP